MSAFASHVTNNIYWRWFTILFIVFLVISLPIVLVFVILFWLPYYFISGRQPKLNLQKTLQFIEPPVLFIACLMVALSLIVTTDVGHLTYAGFPFHFITFYNFPVTDPPANFWERFIVNWNIDGRLHLNIFVYYLLIVALRQIVIKITNTSG